MKLSVLIPNRLEENIEDFVKEVERVLPAAQIIIATDRYSKGKGWAIREALSQADGDVIAFLDGDRDIEPRMLLRLLPFIEDYDVVVGSKKNHKAPLHRKVITHLSRIYIRLMFGLTCDTQTGIKLFRKCVLGKWKTDGFAFDLEILYAAKLWRSSIIEVPIEAEIKRGMSWKAVVRTLLETVKIRFFR